MVRLKACYRAEKDCEREGFNSIVVRLKAKPKSGLKKWIASFNSIVVRLKVSLDHVVPQSKGGFQFHSGSIKRIFFFQNFSASFMFQFHSGSIKSPKVLAPQPGFSIVSIP